MRSFYIIVASVLLVVIAMLFYPSLHVVVDSTNTSAVSSNGTAVDAYPLAESAKTALPYIFLGFAAYAVALLVRGGKVGD